MRLYPDSQGSVNYLFGQPPSLALEEYLEAWNSGRKQL